MRPDPMKIELAHPWRNPSWIMFLHKNAFVVFTASVAQKLFLLKLAIP